MRTRLFADPKGLFVHSAILQACERFGEKTALIDTSLTPSRHLTYAEYAALVEAAAHGMAAAGVRPGEVVGIFLANSWEFCVAYHATTLAGGIPTVINPSYRQRELQYQLTNS